MNEKEKLYMVLDDRDAIDIEPFSETPNLDSAFFDQVKLLKDKYMTN